MLELGVLDVYAFQQDFVRFDSTITLLKAEFPDINLGSSYLNMAKRTVEGKSGKSRVSCKAGIR